VSDRKHKKILNLSGSIQVLLKNLKAICTDFRQFCLYLFCSYHILVISIFRLIYVSVISQYDLYVLHHQEMGICNRSGLSLAWTPLHHVFLSLFWGHVLFAFQHNLGTVCRSELVGISVAKFEVGLRYCYFHNKIAHSGF
jgi:hypothetical protein